jgi:hypothetical protein
LIVGFVLASATAQAGEARSLSPAIETPKTAEAPQADETPKYVERPALVETRSEQSKAAQSNVEPAKPLAEKTASGSKAEKPATSATGPNRASSASCIGTGFIGKADARPANYTSSCPALCRASAS